jgi:homoserine/homoserine lactone efflux protein
MAWEAWLTFFGAAIAISVSPGAGAIQSMATGLTHGVRRGYWSIVGLEIGLMLQLALVAIGLGAAVANSILAFNIIKWMGVAYLLYLAARQWRTPPVDLREQIDHATDGGRMALLVRGFLVNATNPKGLVFFLAVLPQFVVPTQPLLPQYLAVGVTMVAVDLVVMGLYTGLSVRLVKWLHAPRKQTMMNRVFSGLFAAAAVCCRWCDAVPLPSDQAGQRLHARARQSRQGSGPSGQKQQQRVDGANHLRPVTRRPIDIRCGVTELLEGAFRAEWPAHGPYPFDTRAGGVRRHLSPNTERNRDVLAVHEDVEKDVAIVGHLRQPSRRRVLAQFGNQVCTGSLCMTYREVAIHRVKPAARPHTFDEHRQGTRWLRRQSHMGSDVLDPPAVT